jgi:hypothetical protein
MLTLVVKPQWVCYKLDETIERPCIDFLAHTLEVYKGPHLYNEYSAIQDDHDSWGMCTTSTECKTIITAMLTVMSDMDPHMISGNLGWIWLSLGRVVSKWVRLWVGHSETL